jgi:uncharacterized protein
LSDGLTPDTLMSKAVRACGSARVLFELGDVDGACNRAYYARSLSDLSDRSEPGGRARTDFHVFEAHSWPMQRKNGETWTALPTGAVDQPQVRQAPRFDSARAALLVANAPVPAEVGKTHGGLITAFSQHLVKNGPIPKDIGRLLKRAEEIGLVADYKGDSVELADAREMVEQAERFVEAIRNALVPGHPANPNPSELS